MYEVDVFAVFYLGRRAAKKQESTMDMRDPKVKQEFIASELKKAQVKLTEGTFYYCVIIGLERGIDCLAFVVTFYGQQGCPLASNVYP